MPIRNTFANYLNKVKTFNSFKYIEGDLLSPGLWNVLAKYISVYGNLLTVRISLKERKLYLIKCSFLKRTILKFSTTLMVAYPVITFLLLIKKLLFTRQAALDDVNGTLRTLIMFYIVFCFPAFIPTSAMISFRDGPISQIVNPIVDFRDRIRGK